MSVFDRAALEASPLADLHAIASELAMDGYRRLRKADLIDAIIARQEGDEQTAEAEEVAGEEQAAPEEREAAEETVAGARRRRGRRRGAALEEESAAPEEEDAAEDQAAAEEQEAAEEAVAGARRRRGRRGGRGRAARGAAAEGDDPGTPSEGAKDIPAEPAEEEPAARAEDRDERVEGVVELLPNGSGFIRVSPPDPSDRDVYISAAQAKRCELVSGDVVSGPRRPPQRSERFASLFRIDTVNGKPAADFADRGRFDDLAATFPTERFRLGAEDPTGAAIEWLTPFGRGSRVAVTGGTWAGKSHALRLLAAALAGEEDVTLLLTLVGVRPEELPEWAQIEAIPDATAALSFASSADAQDHAVELAIEQARRVAVRGGDAVVLIDTLDGLHPLAARKALGSARNLVEGGSVTVIATSSQPLGGETTVIALDRQLTAAGRFPPLDLTLSGTLRAELLVGEDGARAITEARGQALSSD
jgi:transcription termination factor Rho